MEFEMSILELCKRKHHLLQEVNKLDKEIEFLKKLQEEYDRNDSKIECA